MQPQDVERSLTDDLAVRKVMTLISSGGIIGYKLFSKITHHIPCKELITYRRVIGCEVGRRSRMNISIPVVPLPVGFDFKVKETFPERTGAVGNRGNGRGGIGNRGIGRGGIGSRGGGRGGLRPRAGSTGSGSQNRGPSGNGDCYTNCTGTSMGDNAPTRSKSKESPGRLENFSRGTYSKPSFGIGAARPNGKIKINLGPRDHRIVEVERLKSVLAASTKEIKQEKIECTKTRKSRSKTRKAPSPTSSDTGSVSQQKQTSSCKKSKKKDKHRRRRHRHSRKHRSASPSPSGSTSSESKHSLHRNHKRKTKSKRPSSITSSKRRRLETGIQNVIRKRSRSRSTSCTRSLGSTTTTSREGSRRISKRNKRSPSPPSISKSPKESIGLSISSVTPDALKIPHIFPDILKLQAAGKWDPIRAEQYNKMEFEEKALVAQLKLLHSELCHYPDSHPEYESEWLSYWKAKYKEVEAAKQDPNKYNYIPEWHTHWKFRVDQMVRERFIKSLNKIRERYGFDDASLLKMLHVSQSATSVAPTPVPSDTQVKVTFVHSVSPFQISPPAPAAPVSRHNSEYEHSSPRLPVSKSSKESTLDATVRPTRSGHPPATVEAISTNWEKLTGLKVNLPPEIRANKNGQVKAQSPTLTSGPVPIIDEVIANGLTSLKLTGPQIPISNPTTPTQGELTVLNVLDKLLGWADLTSSILAPKIQYYWYQLKKVGKISNEILLEDSNLVELLKSCHKRLLSQLFPFQLNSDFDELLEIRVMIEKLLQEVQEHQDNNKFIIEIEDEQNGIDESENYSLRIVDEKDDDDYDEDEPRLVIDTSDDNEEENENHEDDSQDDRNCSTDTGFCSPHGPTSTCTSPEGDDDSQKTKFNFPTTTQDEDIPELGDIVPKSLVSLEYSDPNDTGLPTHMFGVLKPVIAEVRRAQSLSKKPTDEPGPYAQFRPKK